MKMSCVNKDNLENVCRICLENKEDMIGIFDRHAEHIANKTDTICMADIISQCNQFKVQANDKLPQQMCSTCQEKACQAYAFKRVCEESYMHLLKLLNIISTTKENEEHTEETQDPIEETSHPGEVIPDLLKVKAELNEKEDEYEDCYPIVNEMIKSEEYFTDEVFAKDYLTTGDFTKDILEEPLIKVEDVFCTKRNHDIVKEVIEEYKCQDCNKIYNSKLTLKRHGAKAHNKRTFNCLDCTQSYYNNDELNAHMRQAKHGKQLLCTECGSRFFIKRDLVIHLRRHNGIKPFKCRFCEKAFPRINDVRLHEKYHTGEKTHFCEICGRGFCRKYNLTTHMRVHTGEKPYKCTHCPQAFAQSHDLKVHIRRHTGEKFYCEFCGEGFVQFYQKRQHKNKVHGTKEEANSTRLSKFISPQDQERQIQFNQQKETV